MKTLKQIIIGIVLCLSGSLTAQVSVNINIGSPPPWGPVGYTEVRYYYLPDVEAYYDIQSAMFIYYGGGAWVHRAYLPTQYRNYDLYYGYKVVMTDYHGSSPYVHFSQHKVKYKKGYRGGPQKTIGSKPGKGNSKSTAPSNKQKASPAKSGGKENAKSGSHGNGGGKGKKK